MLARVGFLPPTDPRIIGTVEAIQRELMVDGFVLRYPTSDEDGVDGLPAGEGTFLMTTFWLVDNLALIGRRRRGARAVREAAEPAERRGHALRGVRPEHQAADRQLPPGVLPPRADRLGVAPVRVTPVADGHPHRARRHRHEHRPLRRHHHRHRRGRRHARPHAGRRRASGSCCSSAATSCRARWRTGIPSAVFVDGRYISEDTWYDADGTAFQPQVHYFVGGATKLYGAALYRLRPQDFGELHHVDGLSPAWPLDLRRLRAVLHEGRVALPGARQPRRGPDRGPLEQAVPVAGGLARAAHPAARPTTWQPGGYHPFHAPCGILLDEADRARSTCIRCTWCDGYPCLVHAKSDAETIAVRPILDLPNVTLLVDAEVDQARDRRRRAAPSPASSSPRGGSDEVYDGRHRRGLGRARRTAPSSCCARRTTSIRTGSPTAPTRSGGTTCSTTARPSSRSPRSRNDTVFQKTLGINDFYFGADDYDWPVGNIQMVGKSNAEAMKGEEPKLTKLAPHWSASPTSPSTPSTSG